MGGLLDPPKKRLLPNDSPTSRRIIDSMRGISVLVVRSSGNVIRTGILPFRLVHQGILLLQNPWRARGYSISRFKHG